MNNTWKTTVSELLEIFRGAIIAIIPWVEKAKISWKEGESYDDWDNIVSSLFENIVYASLTENISDKYSLPKYDLQYEDYLDRDFILIRSRKFPNNNFAFISYNTKSSNLSTINAAELDDNYSTIRPVELPLDDLVVGFLMRDKNKIEVLYKLNIDL